MSENAGDAGVNVAAGVEAIGCGVFEGLLTPIARQYLRETVSWMRFISIFVFVVTGVMVLAGGVMVLIGVASIVMRQSAGAPESFGAGAGVMGVTYLVFSCLYLAAGVLLLRYARAMKGLEASGDAASLEGALRSQKSFWRLVGIVTIASVIAMGLGLLAGIFMAIASVPYRA